MSPRRSLLLLLSGVYCAWLNAQIDTLLPAPPTEIQDIIEDVLQNQGGEEEFDFNAVFEELAIYLEHPLNLNRATEGELRELRLLSDRQILELLRYRLLAGDLLAIYELQVIPTFDQATIERILPFVTLNTNLDNYQVAMPEMAAYGKNEFYLRWGRVAEQQLGYTPPPPGSTAQRYLGDPNQLYFRYRHTYSNRLSFGLTAEKDRGEEFFRGSNRQGFDYYSAHLYLRDYNRTLRALALGDYGISLGQGLLLFAGFSYGKSIASTSIKRSGRTVSPFASANEAAALRGAAATLGLGKNLELTTFVSLRRRDANLLQPDTTDAGDRVQNISAFDLDGYHRTPSEIADEGAVRQLTTGGSLRFQARRGHLALNAVYDRFNRQLELRPQPYNRFYFQGRQLFNASVDYAYLWQNIHLFGETAAAENGRLATLNGAIIGLDRRADLAVLVRYYPRDYVALNANPFAETSGGRNETGLYLGLEVRPLPNWTLNTYFDSWRHPWLRFDADAPSRGQEFRARLTYTLKRRLTAYLETRDETKERNVPGHSGAVQQLTPQRLFQVRLHLAPQLSKTLELRTRLDWGFADNGVEPRQFGFMALQDILVRPLNFPLSFTTRFAIFDTDGYDVRFYHYENDLLYTFSVPPYYNRGTRFYVNLRYRPAPALTLEARFAQTYWANQPTIGSGTEQIDGPVRTQFGAQVKYQFSN